MPPSPKSGSPGSMVAPTAPTAPEPADDADPGQMEELKERQKQDKTGKYGSEKAPKREKKPDEPKKPHWIEVELVDEAGDPVPGQPCQILQGDVIVATRSTDAKGCIRVEDLDPGSYDICFPKLDKDAWEPG